MPITPGSISRAVVIISAKLRVVAKVKERDGTPLELIEVEDILEIEDCGEILELVEMRNR